LQDQTWGCDPAARSDTKKIAAALQRFDREGQKEFRCVEGCFEIRSSGQALAALGPASRQNPPPSRRRHSRAKTMAALANNPTGLVSALHDRESENGIFSGGCGYIVEARNPVNGAAADAAEGPGRSRCIQVGQQVSACHFGGDHHAGSLADV
jgi:hypothetical protein